MGMFQTRELSARLTGYRVEAQMSPNSIFVQKNVRIDWTVEEKPHCLWGMTFLIVLHDEIDYSYTHYIHEARHLFSSFGIDLVSFQGKVVK